VSEGRAIGNLETEHRLCNTDSAEQMLAMCRARTAGWEVRLSDWFERQKPWLMRRCAAHLGNVFEAEDAV